MTEFVVPDRVVRLDGHDTIMLFRINHYSEQLRLTSASREHKALEDKDEQIVRVLGTRDGDDPTLS